jgi:hypothetical protein
VAKIQNLERLVGKLRALAGKARTDKEASVLVGFTAAYAIYVHEDMEAEWLGQPRKSGKGVYWGPSLYGPKFLEGPFREFKSVLFNIVLKAMKKRGTTMAQALLLAGLRLQRESQLRVPVEYGNLRASAFTRLE